MNREIKFRAKPIGSNTWLYGGGVVKTFNDKWVMLHLDDDQRIAVTIIDPATVSQFTGLKDKNGKEIYEGDIVTAPSKWDGYEKLYYGEVVFLNGCFKIRWREDGVLVRKTINVAQEIVGNIHDNLGLLK